MIQSRCFLFSIVVTCFFVGCYGDLHGEESEWRSAHASLYVAARSFNLGPPSFSGFLKKFGSSEETTVNGAEFVEQAEKFGLMCRAVQCDADALLLVRPPTVCVLYLDDARFAIATEVVGNNATVFDPSTGTTESVDLRECWDGKAFFLSDRPILLNTPRRLGLWVTIVLAGACVVAGLVYLLSLHKRIGS